MIILSLFWEKYTENEAIASVITGFLCIPIFKFGMTATDGIGIYFEKGCHATLLFTFYVGGLSGKFQRKF